MATLTLNEKVEQTLNDKKYAPVKDSLTALNLRIMLENTALAAKGKMQGLNEDVVSGDIAQFTPILMPIVRRVYPALVANQLLGVSPLSMPTGYIYALTRRYTGNHDKKITPVSKGQILVFKADYSGNIGDTVTGVDASGGAATGKVVFISKDKRNVLIALDDATKHLVPDANIKATYSNESTFARILKDYTGPYTTADGEKLSTDMAEVGFNIDKVMVEAKTRKLKSEYTLEMYDDLMSQHGLNAEEEIISLISNEMQIEIDREVIAYTNSLAKVGTDSANWFGAGATTMIANTVTAGRALWEIEAYRLLAMRIDLESRDIAIRNKRGAANVILVSPKVATMLSSFDKFVIAPKDSNIGYDLNTGVIGTYDGRYTVVVDQYAENDYITLLYKGTSVQDAIGWFCPYIPLSIQKVVNQDSGQPGIIARTRYGLVAHPQQPDAYATTWAVDFKGTVLSSIN